MDEEKTIEKNVLKYGKMKYSIERICQLLGMDPNQRSQFLSRMEDPDDWLRIIYDKGVAMGDYKMDKYLEKAGKDGNAMAISELGTRQYHRRQDKIKNELFGL